MADTPLDRRRSVRPCADSAASLPSRSLAAIVLISDRRERPSKGERELTGGSDYRLKTVLARCGQGRTRAGIIGAVQECVEQETERIRIERKEGWKQARDAEREALRQRLLSGVDCKWTSLTKSDELFCRMNGRLYRVKQGQDKRWSLSRVASIDDQKGVLLGQYSGRGEANKVVTKIAY